MPSCERQFFIIRSMKYWSNKSVRLVVLDGSKQKIKPSILGKFSKNKNIYYEHSRSSFVQRLSRAKSLINTEYVALIGDDEFYIPSTIVRCINELDKNKDLVACLGTAVSFYPLNGAVYGKPKYPKLWGYEISHNNPRERAKKHMRDYVPSLVYAITRAHQWKIALSAYTDEEFPVFAMIELQMELILSFAGKSKVIPFLMWLRSSKETEKIIQKEKSLNPKNIFPKWWNNKKIKTEHKRFVSIVSKKFALLNPGYEDHYYSKSVIDACNNFIIFSLERKNRRKVNILRRLLRYFIKFIHEDRIRKTKNFIFGLAGWPKLSNNLLIKEVKSMHKKGQTVDFKEVDNIIQIVTDFHIRKSQ